MQPELWWLVFLPLVFVIKRKNYVSLLLVIVASGLLGLWRGSQQLVDLNDLRSYAAQKIVVQGVATTDAVYGNKSQITFELNKIELIEPDQKPLLGTFKISGFGELMIYRGDKVRAEGKLFPTRGGKQASMSYAQIERIAPSQDWMATVRRNFAAGMATALPEPASSLGLGLLIGQRSTLPDNILAAMTAVGLVHIVAVSGYNVTILARAVQRLKITGSKFQKLILALALVGAFVMITGFSASVVRAAIVSLLSLLAWYYGRTINPLVLILFVAALTGFINPIYVWSDIGWYLSFFAFFGVLILAPLIGRRIFGKRYESRPFSMLVIESFSAQLLTLPLIMMIFGRASIISLPANLLVVPIVPFAMLFGAVAAFFGAVVAPLAGWFAWPATLLLTYIIDITQIASHMPLASLSAGITLASMLLAYVIIGLLALALYRHNRQKAVAASRGTSTPQAG